MKQAREWVVIVKGGTLVLEKVLAGQPLTLDYMQGIVGGYIEIVDRLSAGKMALDVWGNEEGKVMGLPLNVFRRDGEPLVGPLLVTAGNPRTGTTLPLTLEEAQRVKLATYRAYVTVPILTITED